MTDFRQARAAGDRHQFASAAIMDSIYREQILDHYKYPRFKGVLDPSDRSFTADNPLCGDRIRIDMRLDGERVVEASFSGDGCAISQASASMLMATMHPPALCGRSGVHASAYRYPIKLNLFEI